MIDHTRPAWSGSLLPLGDLLCLFQYGQSSPVCHYCRILFKALKTYILEGWLISRCHLYLLLASVDSVSVAIQKAKYSDYVFSFVICRLSERHYSVWFLGLRLALEFFGLRDVTFGVIVVVDHIFILVNTIIEASNSHVFKHHLILYHW